MSFRGETRVVKLYSNENLIGETRNEGERRAEWLNILPYYRILFIVHSFEKEAIVDPSFFIMNGTPRPP